MKMIEQKDDKHSGVHLSKLFTRDTHCGCWINLKNCFVIVTIYQCHVIFTEKQICQMAVKTNLKCQLSGPSRITRRSHVYAAYTQHYGRNARVLHTLSSKIWGTQVLADDCMESVPIGQVDIDLAQHVRSLPLNKLQIPILTDVLLHFFFFHWNLNAVSTKKNEANPLYFPSFTSSIILFLRPDHENKLL